MFFFIFLWLFFEFLFDVLFGIVYFIGAFLYVAYKEIFTKEGYVPPVPSAQQEFLMRAMQIERDMNKRYRQ